VKPEDIIRERRTRSSVDMCEKCELTYLLGLRSHGSLGGNRKIGRPHSDWTHTVKQGISREGFRSVGVDG